MKVTLTRTVQIDGFTRKQGATIVVDRPTGKRLVKEGKATSDEYQAEPKEEKKEKKRRSQKTEK